jgi:hypothetical protein
MLRKANKDPDYHRIVEMVAELQMALDIHLIQEILQLALIE